MMMKSAVWLLIIGVAALTVRADSPEDMRRRLDMLIARYRTSNGNVDVSKMTAEEARDYKTIQTFFWKSEIRERATHPPLCKLGELPVPTKGTFSMDVDETQMPDGAIVTSDGPWTLTALKNESLAVVPRGWEIKHAGDETHLLFPFADWTPKGFGREIDPRLVVHVRLGVRPGASAAALHAEYRKVLAGLIETKELAINDLRDVGENAGWFAIKNLAQRRATIVYFTPDPNHKGEGNAAVIDITEERWASFRPVLETMLKHWYSLDGRPLGAAIKLDGVITPATAADPNAPGAKGSPTTRPSSSVSAN